MKKDIESEYMSAVAKRTRASTERFLAKKVYGESGVWNGKRIPDVKVLVDDDDDDDDEVERDGDRNRKRKVVKETKERELNVDRRKEKDKDKVRKSCFSSYSDDIPVITIVDSQESDSVGDDDDDDEEEIVRIRKRKGKMMMAEETDVVDNTVTDFVNKACKCVGSEDESESESVRDNDDFNGRCKCSIDVSDDDDDSVGSRMELGSSSKPAVDVDIDETECFSISSNGVENENGNEGSGNEMVSSSDEESGTEVSSSDSDEDDDSDEDYNEPMANVSCSSECASESDDDFVEEFAPCDKMPVESYSIERDDEASPCCSDDVIILDDDFVVNGNGNYAKPVAEEILVDGTTENEYVADKLDEKNPFRGNGCSSKSASTAKVLEANRTKVDDFASTAFEENINHPENKFSKSTGHAQGSANNEPEIEVTSAMDDGTVPNVNRSETPSLKNTSSVEPVMMPAESGLIFGTNRKIHGSKINRDAGFNQGIRDNNNEEASVVGSVNQGKRFTNEDSKTMTDHVENRKVKETHLDEFASTRDDANEEQQQGIYQEKYRKANSKKTRTWEKINLFDLLFNTLTSKSRGVHEDVVNDTEVTQQEEHPELAAPKSYPMLKFTFGAKTPVQEEKPEFEKELDKLWDEFQFELRTSEIGSHAHVEVKTDNDTSPKNIKIYPTLCNRGEHKFTLIDEVGIQCQICSFVQLEMKYVMPDWAKFSSRRCNRISSFDIEDVEMFDGMQFHDSKVEESRSCSVGTVWDLIPDVRDKLFPHQQDGFEFIWQNLMGTISLDELRSTANHRMGGCIISHAPGTGKTRLTLEFLHSYLKLFPCSCPLIIAPAGMLLTWEAEFKKWDVGIPFHNFNSTVLSGKEDRTALNMFNASKQRSTTQLLRLIKLFSWSKEKSILGLSYSLFEKLAGQRFDDEKNSQSGNKKTRDEDAQKIGKILLEKAGLLVLDEGHTPRNPRSRIYKALTNIETKKRIILSGTPFQNNLAELFTILSFVRPDFAETISPELRKFCQRKVRMVDMSSGRSADVDKDDLVAINQLRTKIDPFVHVHKGSVLQESLPGLKDCVMVLNPPQYQKQLVEAIESNSYTNFEFEHRLSLVTIHPSLLQNEKAESFIDKEELEARKLDPNEGVKTKFLFEMIRLSEANNEKVLVFSQYLDPLGLIMDQICTLLNWREGEEVLRLVGKIDSEQRQSIINRFNNPRSNAKVLLASTRACSEGINLVGASRVVLLDVVWNPSVERQAISRAFRLGQKKVVYSYNLIVGRMEWEKYRAQTNKEHVSNLVFCSTDEPEKRSRVLSEDKILDELINHSSMDGMFDQIVYHPKDKLFS